MSFQALIQAKELCTQGHRCLQMAFDNREVEWVAEAISFYGEAIACWPELEEPYLALAYLAWQNGQSDKSYMLIKKVLELNPSHHAAKLFLEKNHPQLFFPSAEPVFNARSVRFPGMKKPEASV